MRNFVYSGGLSGGLLRHIKDYFFSYFQNEVKSVLNIKESYSMKKKPKKCSKNFASSFIKRRGGQRPFINFIKKQTFWYRTASLRMVKYAKKNIEVLNITSDYVSSESFLSETVRNWICCRIKKNLRFDKSFSSSKRLCKFCLVSIQ